MLLKKWTSSFLTSRDKEVVNKHKQSINEEHSIKHLNALCH